jgi:hypothetical protein
MEDRHGVRVERLDAAQKKMTLEFNSLPAKSWYGGETP